MTAPAHTTTESVEPAVATEPEPAPVDDGIDDKTENFRAVESSRDTWRSRAEAAEKVLEAAGIEVAEDGSFDPEQIQTLSEPASPEALRRAALIEAGFDAESGKGRALLKVMASEDVDLDVEAIRNFAQSEFDWKPERIWFAPSELDAIADARRLEVLQSNTVSEHSGSPQSQIEKQIAEARADGDFATASRLQSQWDRKKSRR